MGPDGEVLGSARGGGTTRRDHCSTGSMGLRFPFMPACTLPGPLLWTQFSTRITHGLQQIFEGHTAKDIRGMIKSCPFPGTQRGGNYRAKPWTADKAWVWLKRLLIAANANNHDPADYTLFECLWISEFSDKRHNGVSFVFSVACTGYYSGWMRVFSLAARSVIDNNFVFLACILVHFSNMTCYLGQQAHPRSLKGQVISLPVSYSRDLPPPLHRQLFLQRSLCGQNSSGGDSKLDRWFPTNTSSSTFIPHQTINSSVRMSTFTWCYPDEY